MYPLAKARFIHRHVAGTDIFLDGPTAKARDSVRVVFACEKVRQEYTDAAPEGTEAEIFGDSKFLTLEAMVRMKLTSFRLKDQVHIQDMIGVGLIEKSWKDRVPSERTSRLQELLDNPEG